MTRLRLLLPCLGIFLLGATVHGQNLSVNAPATAAGGSLVTVTGTSTFGEFGTALSAEDEYGPIELMSVVWNGDSFTATYRAPAFDEDPEALNEVEFTARANGRTASDTTTITP